MLDRCMPGLEEASQAEAAEEIIRTRPSGSPGVHVILHEVAIGEDDKT